MGAAFGVVAFLIALAGFLATVGNAGYLAVLFSAAERRGLSGESTSDYVRTRRGPAALLVLVALIGIVFTYGGPVADLVGLVLGAGSGLAGYRALDGTRRRFSGRS